MLSIKNNLLVLGLIANLGGFAVNELNKVEELYKASKFDKAYKKAFKLKGESAYYKKAKTYYFMGFSLLNLSKEESKKLGVSTREKSIVFNVSKGLRYQKNDAEFSRFKSSKSDFVKLAKNRMVYAKKSRKEKEWRDIAKMLATHFKDTAELYWEAFPKKTNAVLVKEKITKPTEVQESESISRDAIVAKAKTYIGVPYKYAGESRRGIDCSGFTSKILNQFGANLPHSAKLQSSKGKKVKKYKAGDLAFFGYKKGSGGVHIKHVALVVSNYPDPLKVIHATSSLGVREDEIPSSSYWKPKFLYAVRVLE